MSEEGRAGHAIAVLGMHRSGTSAIAGALAAAGADFGDTLIPPKADNPKGFFEHTQVVELNDALLLDHLQAWDSVRDLPPLAEVSSPQRVRAMDTVAALAEGGACCGLKDPRLSLFLPFWASVFEAQEIAVHWVVCLRRPDDVARSLFARDRFSADKSHALWLKYNLALLTGLEDIGARGNATMLSFDALLAGEASAREAASGLLDDLGLDHDPFFDFIEAPLASRASVPAQEGALAALCDEVYGGLLAQGPARAPIKEWRVRWQALAPAVQYIDLQYESLTFLEAQEKKWVDGLQRALSDKDAELARVNDYTRHLLSLIESAQVEASKQRSYMQALEKDLADQRVEGERHKAQVQTLLNRCEKYFVASSEAEERLHEARVEAERLKGEVAAIDGERDRVDEALRHVQEELARVYTSTSWKVSAPVRMLKRGLGGA